jgi:hypothetical protein
MYGPSIHPVRSGLEFLAAIRETRIARPSSVVKRRQAASHALQQEPGSRYRKFGMTTGQKGAIVAGTVATVLGGLILQALGAVDLFGMASAIGQWLGASATVPRWSVVLFALIIGANLIALVVVLRRRIAKPPWSSYFTDVFFGVRWRWRYHSDYSINSESIVPFCPQCDHRLIAGQHSTTPATAATTARRQSVTDAWLQFNPKQETTFRCEACGFSHSEQGELKDFARRVTWGIEQRISRGQLQGEADVEA